MSRTYSICKKTEEQEQGPGTYKDESLRRSRGHLIVEGMVPTSASLPLPLAF
jgi:NADH:ubiquinone oxidoreductase subunit F (NADH-binding)